MSDGLIGAASILTRTSDPPMAASARFFSLSTKPKRDINVSEARLGIFGSNHLPKVGQHVCTAMYARNSALLERRVAVRRHMGLGLTQTAHGPSLVASRSQCPLGDRSQLGKTSAIWPSVGFPKTCLAVRIMWWTFQHGFSGPSSDVLNQHLQMRTPQVVLPNRHLEFQSQCRQSLGQCS